MWVCRLPVHIGPAECSEFLREFAANPQAVTSLDVGGDAHIAPLGSCEFAEDSRKIGTSFPILADYSIFPVGNRLIYATHGHVYNTAHLPPLCPGDILLHGHTHVPAWEPFGEENLYLNPGSVSIPKNGSTRGYLTLEDGVFQWKTLSGDVYHTLTL